MASPIKWFRKYRKESLAVLTLLAMLSFVFVPMLLQLGERSPAGPRNELRVTTTKYGNLREEDVQQLVQQRGRLQGFFQRLLQEVRSNGGQGTAIQGFLQEMQAAGSPEDAAVENWLLEHRANDLGLKATNDTVVDFLKDVSDGKTDGTVIQKILAQMQYPQSMFLQALGRELLARQMRQMFAREISSTTPEERYDYFLRLNRAAKIEAIPVVVEKSVDKVNDPTDKELRTFFDKFKDEAYDPISPEPGFREPHRIDVQFFKADYEKFLDLKSVSDEEIKDYYETNKDRFREPELPPPAVPTKPETTKPEAAKPAEAAKPEASKPETPKAETPKPEAAKPEAPKAEPEKAKPAEKEPGKTSAVERRSPFRLVAFAEEKKPDEKKAEQPAPKAEQSAPKTEQPAPKAETPAPKAEAAKPEAAKEDASASKTPEAKKESPKKEVKYRPLDKVRDEIRRELAVQKAQEKVEAVLARLQDRMIQYNRQWINYDAESKKNKDATPPTELDFATLAKEAGVTTGRTGMVSALEAQPLDIGRSRVGNNVPFTTYAFSKLPLFQPVRSNDLQGNSYLFWKIGETEEAVPDLAEPTVRERVLKAWKLIEARKYAKDEAERLVAKVQKGTSLKEVAAVEKGTSIITPDPFTWMTYGTMPPVMAMMYGRPPQISEVKGVEYAGMDFMRSVFHLQPGGAGVAWNHPQTVVYTVRLIEFTPLENTLWESFLKANPGTYLLASQPELRAMYLAWLKQVQTDAGFRWMRKPQAGPGVQGYAETE